MSNSTGSRVSRDIIATLNGLSDEDVETFAAVHQDASDDNNWEVYMLCRFTLFIRNRFTLEYSTPQISSTIGMR